MSLNGVVKQWNGIKETATGGDKEWQKKNAEMTGASLIALKNEIPESTCSYYSKDKWASAWQNLQNGMWAQWRRRSAWASV